MIDHKLIIFIVNHADFYNWNKVFVRYCDGGAFTGDIENVDPVCSFSIYSFYFKTPLECLFLTFL